MKWKTVITVLYIAGAAAAGAVFINAETKGVESPAVSSVSPDTGEDYKKQIDILTAKVSELNESLSRTETENDDLIFERNALQSEVDRLTLEAETKAAEEAAAAETEAEAEEAEAEEEAAGEEAAADAETEKEENGTYYTYKINTSSEPLNLYRKKNGGKPVNSIPRGYIGYVISLGEEKDNRALILFEGKLYYASKSYMKFTGIAAEDYPDELLSLSASDIGTTFFDGKAIGIERKK